MKPSHQNWLLSALRLLLGGLFLVAGCLKVADPPSFAETIGNYQLVPENLLSLLSFFLPWLEIVLAVCLLCGFFTRAAATLSSLVTATFAVAVASVVIRGIDTSCGCFSDTSQANWGHVVLNLLMLAAGLTILAKGPGTWSLDQRFEGKIQKSSKSLALVTAILFALNLVYLAPQVSESIGHGSQALPKDPDAIPLTFAQPLLDLGDVMQGTVSERSLEFRNNTNETITIRKVDATCGCTVPKIGKANLGPNESTDITVRFTPGIDQGSNNTLLEIYIDGYSKPVEYLVKANVLPLVETIPALLKLTSEGESKTFRLVSRKPDLDFKIVDFISPVSALDFTVLDYPEPGQARIEVKLVKPLPAPEEPYTAWQIPIATNLPGVPPAILYIQKGEL